MLVGFVGILPLLCSLCICAWPMKIGVVGGRVACAICDMANGWRGIPDCQDGVGVGYTITCSVPGACCLGTKPKVGRMDTSSLGVYHRAQGWNGCHWLMKYLGWHWWRPRNRVLNGLDIYSWGPGRIL